MKNKLVSPFIKKLLALVIPIAFQQFMSALVSASNALMLGALILIDLGMFAMCTYYLIGKSINSTTIAGIFCADGDSKFGFLCDTVIMWCITVPCGFLAAFVFHLSVLVVYFVMNLDEMIKLPAVYQHYRKYQ